MGRQQITLEMSGHMDTIARMKLDEAPEFVQGQLIRRKPKRHCIPRSHFYYSSDEWFCPPANNQRLKLRKNTSDTVAKQPINKQESEESVFPDSEEYKKYNIQIPSKVYADTYIRRDASKWKSTPVPGMRTCPESDKYRQVVINDYEQVYHKDRGVVPKYGGYVPGLKFRYGSPFGQLTYNAREVGVPYQKSRTWGGAVSLF